MFTIVHDIPGRLRLRAPLHRRDASEFHARAANVAGVTDVAVNTQTGSVLVRYAGDGVRQRLLSEFGAVEPKLDPDRTAQLLADAFTKALVEWLASMAVAALV